MSAGLAHLCKVSIHTLSVSEKLITESPMSHYPETGFGEIDG